MNEHSALVLQRPVVKKERALSDQRREISFRMSEVQDPMVVINLEHEIVDCNGQFMRLFGVTGEDFGQKSIHDLVPEGLRDKHRANVESVYRTPAVRNMSDPRSRVVALGPDGKTFPVFVIFFPVRCIETNAVEGICAIVSERSEKKVPIYLQAQNWIPFVAAIIAGIGWILGVEGAKEILVSVVGVRTVLGGINAMDKNKEGR